MPAQQYTLRLIEYFKKNNLEMTEVPNWGPRIV